MSVVSLPPDGASRKFKASQENNVASKQQLVEKERLSIEESLRKKIEIGDIQEGYKESAAGQLHYKYANQTWPYEKIMSEFEANVNNPEAYKKIMYQRQAIEMFFKWVDLCIQRGKEARQQLANTEKQQA